MTTKEEVIGVMAAEYAEIFGKLSDAVFAQVEEVRIRAERPLSLVRMGREYFVSGRGQLLEGAGAAAYGRAEAIRKTVELLCNHSPYAFENEMGAGYITIKGGHRVGLVGRAVTEGGRVRTLRNISGLNFRLSHAVTGCALGLAGHIMNGQRPHHTLIISPPGCGKTTLLRDTVRMLSDGLPGRFGGLAVAVVDERSEIAGCYMGVPQHDVGVRTDVLDACPKVEGMMMLLRSMSPKVLAVDEVGRAEDARAVEDVINAGVAVLCTAHGATLDEVRVKPAMRPLMDGGLFGRIAVLRGRGQLAAVYDGEFNILEGQA